MPYEFNLKISEPDIAIERMFRQKGFTFDPAKRVDAIVFGGGADIIPFLYGEERHTKTNCDYERDLKEIKLFKTFSTTPKIGICRGGQLLNTLSGGRMYQHVDNHAGQHHDVYDIETGDLIRVTSTHHQMMRPSPQGRVIAYAGKAKNKATFDLNYELDPDKDPAKWSDTEVVWYEHSRSLCFQPHPEYNVKSCEDYFFSLFNQYILPYITRQREILAAAKNKEVK